MKLVWRPLNISDIVKISFKNDIYDELYNILEELNLISEDFYIDYNVEIESVNEIFNVIISGNNKQANENLKQVDVYRELNML